LSEKVQTQGKAQAAFHRFARLVLRDRALRKNARKITWHEFSKTFGKETFVDFARRLKGLGD
jgi:hypothetical protein